MPYIGNTVQNQGFTPAIDYFSGNGVTVTFTLSRPVVSVAQMIVAIDNVIQNPSSAYTVSGSSITFTSAPLAGTNNIWVEYTSLITSYNAISQNPSVIGDLTASGGYLAVGSFGNTFIDGTVVDYTTGNGRITVGPADGFTIYNGGTGARNPLTTWDAYGNVGIGTTTPSSYSGKFQVAIGDGSGWYGNFGSSSTGVLLGVRSSTASVGTNGANTLALNPDGGKIAVNTTTTTPLGSQTGASNVSTFNQAGITLTQYGVTAGFYYDRLNFNNSQYFVVNSSGTGVYLGNGSTSWTAYSDARLKNVISGFSNALNDVSQLEPVKFTWKSDESEKPCVGLIAQSVEKVLPEAVDKSKLPDGEDETEYLAVRYTEVIPLLVAAIQELKAEVDALKAQLEAK